MGIPNNPWKFEAKHGHYLAKRHKMAEKTKKRSLAKSSSVLSPEGKDQVSDEKEQLVRRQTVPRRNTIFYFTKFQLQIRFHLSVFGLFERELDRVNPSPFPTHSVRECEWAKVEAMLKCSNSVLKRNRVDL
ncbi:hypothetical protein H5410_030387, partial [Solanum commersonii]